MIYYYSLFTIFAISLTMMVIDPNVSDYIVLLSKLVKSKVERLYWMIRFHPIVFSNPVAQWWMMRKHMKTVEKLAQELSKRQDDAV